MVNNHYNSNVHYPLKDVNTNESKVYKVGKSHNISDCKIVSMIPGDLAVAGCFIFLGGLC